MFLTKTITVMLVIIALILIKSTWMWCAAMLSSIMPKPMWRWPLLRTLYGLVQQRMSFRPTMGNGVLQGPPGTSGQHCMMSQFASSAAGASGNSKRPLSEAFPPSGCDNIAAPWQVCLGDARLLASSVFIKPMQPWLLDWLVMAIHHHLPDAAGDAVKRHMPH